MVNWGIIGTGAIARAFAISMGDSQESNLVAVASRTRKNADKFALKQNCIGIHGYKELIDNSQIEAVYIATPHTSHFELALYALNAKKAVLCEKPMTINATETMVLIDSARRNKVLLMEAFMYRFHPQTEKIREIVREEFEEKRLTIAASFGFKMGLKGRMNKNHRLLDPKLGGGSILDIGCYPLSMSRMVVGVQEGKAFSNPLKLEAEGELSSRGVDLFAGANLFFSNGTKASISSSINKALKNSVLISDGQKSLMIDQPWQCGESNGRSSKITLFDKNSKPTIFEFKQRRGVFTHEIDHFVELMKIKALESEKMSHADSHVNMIWLDSWRKKIGVHYSEDKPENRHSSLLGSSSFEQKLSMPSSTLKGLEVKPSRLVFGCDNQSDSNHAFAMFDHFFMLGGNVFDTAYIYNEGRSDAYLGRWIKERGVRNEVVILGKGAHTPDCYPNLIRKQLEESLTRLKTDNIDIYCLHRDNIEVPVGEFVDSLNELKREGLIKTFGASNWSLQRFKQAFDYTASTGLEFFSVLSNNFSLARMKEPVWPGCESCSEEDFKSFLTQKQIPIFPWSSQARGFFLENKEFEGSIHVANPDKKEEVRVWHNRDNLERRKRCFSLAKKKGIEPIELALAFVLNQNFPSFPLIGPRNFFETRSSLKALEVNLSEDEREWLDLRSS